MGEKKKLFVVSDIHGHGSLLREALAAAGFDAADPSHILVCCGDLFDRGTENRAVYDFITALPRKVLIRGNHDERLAEILTEGRMNICDIRNGTDLTLEEFFGDGSVSEYGELRLPPHSETAERLLALVGGMANYYETEHYVFVHGWIPTVPGVKPLCPRADWREADARAWKSARFTEWTQLHGVNDMLPGKTVVCGHRPTYLAYTFDPARTLGDSSVYYGEGMIAIDAGTIRSGRVNVLVLEEEITERMGVLPDET